MSQIELISHPLCPFNQRSALILLFKGLKRDKDFKITYVDLGYLPDWFLELSPDKSMPVLRYNEHFLFNKTTPINEFLDEITAGSLHSEKPLERAEDRSWVEYCGEILNILRTLFTAVEAENIEKAIYIMFDMFKPVEQKLEKNTTYWRNQHFTHVDAAFAPLFSLLFHFDFFRNHSNWKKYPKTKYWGERLVESDITTESVCPDFSGEFDYFFGLFSSYFPKYVKNFQD